MKLSSRAERRSRGVEGSAVCSQRLPSRNFVILSGGGASPPESKDLLSVGGGFDAGEQQVPPLGLNHPNKRNSGACREP
jgi:hypothetical protein